MKKVLLILITFLTFINVEASVKTFERTEDNLGVNKDIQITDEIKQDILKTPLVDSKEKVYDFAGILTESNIESLKTKANKFIDKTNIDLVLVTINEEIDKDAVKKFSRDFYNYNDFGKNTKNYSGVEIILNNNDSNGFLYIISFGNPEYIKQEDLQKVLDNVLDNFNKGNNYLGFYNFIDLIDKYYQENKLKTESTDKFNGQITTSNILDFERISEVRNSLENYGVKKPAKINENSINHILRIPLVDSKDKVYDFSNVLTDEEENKLREKALQFLEDTGIELIIVTINETYTDQQIEDFADDFFDFNDFGISENSKSYDGILVVRNTNNYNRYYYMSTSGTGQIYFPQSRVDDILDDMYDNMHLDNYYNGFMDFISSAEHNYKKGVPSKYKDCYVDQMGDLFDKNGNPVSWEKGVYRVPFVLATIIGFIVSLIVMLIMISKNKMVKKAVTANDYLDENSIKYTTKQDTFVSTHTSSYRISTSSGGGGGSHHSSGGFSHGGGGRHC